MLQDDETGKEQVVPPYRTCTPYSASLQDFPADPSEFGPLTPSWSVPPQLLLKRPLSRAAPCSPIFVSTLPPVHLAPQQGKQLRPSWTAWVLPLTIRASSPQLQHHIALSAPQPSRTPSPCTTHNCPMHSASPPVPPLPSSIHCANTHALCPTSPDSFPSGTRCHPF